MYLVKCVHVKAASLTHSRLFNNLQTTKTTNDYTKFNSDMKYQQLDKINSLCMKCCNEN